MELWAKYAGAVNYDQPLHRDYGSHSLVVPRPEPRYQQLTTFVYLSDVTEQDGPTHIVPYEDGKDVPYTPLYLPFGALADAEVACTGPAGSLLIYRTDILHRGSDITGPGRSRFSLLADFQVRGTTWGGKMAWPKQSPERWARFLPQCDVRQRDLFGFPRPGDPYWTEETLDGVAERYPGIDLAPYREAPGVTERRTRAGRAPARLRRPARAGGRPGSWSIACGPGGSPRPTPRSTSGPRTLRRARISGAGTGTTRPNSRSSPERYREELTMPPARRGPRTAARSSPRSGGVVLITATRDVEHSAAEVLLGVLVGLRRHAHELPSDTRRRAAQWPLQDSSDSGGMTCPHN